MPWRVSASTIALSVLAASGMLACASARVGGESVATAVGSRENDSTHCGTCHEDVAERYATSVHAERHILCGQCHGGAEHPNPDEWVTDGTCAGCHTSQYQDQVGSAHFDTRALVLLAQDPPEARGGDEERSFFLLRNGMLSFAGREGAGSEGGLLCVGCHYAGHRFTLRSVRREGACETCHSGLVRHYPADDERPANRCIACHVFEGRTNSGRVINSHRFEVSREAAGR